MRRRSPAFQRGEGSLTIATCEVREPWQQAVADSIGDLNQLLLAVGLCPEEIHENTMALALARRQLSLRVPRPYVARMNAGDANDPLLRQVLPSAREMQLAPGFCTDPLGEAREVATPGLLRRFQGRALLLATGACPIHCRFCFRRHFPFAEHGDLGPALDQLRAATGIEEVILSGGDPLMLDNGALGELIHRLAAIPHLRRLRLHSRMPVVLPQRIDDALLACLTGSRLQAVLVVHSNHANEIDDAVAVALRQLVTAGVVVLNQSVLLAGINNSVDALLGLSEALLAAATVPYYLHQLDAVQGAAHFAVAEEQASQLLGDLLTRAPGYLVPRFVRERPGSPFKVPLKL